MEGILNPDIFESGGGAIGRANKPTKEGLADLMKFIGVEAKPDQITEKGIGEIFSNKENKAKLVKFLKEDPISVRSFPDNYLEIKDGNHRYELAKLAKIKEIPVTDKIRFPAQTPQQIAAIAENFELPPMPQTLASGGMATSAKDVGRSLMPVTRRLGAALGTEAASLGGMALRGAGRLAGPAGIALTAYDAVTMGPAMLRDYLDQPTYISDPNAQEKILVSAMNEYKTGPRSSRGVYNPPTNYYAPKFPTVD